MGAQAGGQWLWGRVGGLGCQGAKITFCPVIALNQEMITT